MNRFLRIVDEDPLKGETEKESKLIVIYTTVLHLLVCPVATVSNEDYTYSRNQSTVCTNHTRVSCGSYCSRAKANCVSQSRSNAAKSCIRTLDSI